MIALGSETSSKIMKQLPESMIQQVSYEIANTDYVSPEERDDVMNEFVNTAQARQYVLDGGIEYARNLLNQALGPQKAKEVIDILNQIQLRERPFDIARKADEKQLLNLLLEEQPQTIALIMCYLQPDKAASVLSELPTELQSEVAERIGSISSTSPWVIKAIEQVMKSKFTSFDESETEKVKSQHGKEYHRRFGKTSAGTWRRSQGQPLHVRRHYHVGRSRRAKGLARCA